MRNFLATLLAMALLLGSIPASAADCRNAEPDRPLPQHDRWDRSLFDLAVLRPVGLGALIGGSALWLVATPFTVPSNSVGDAGCAWVLEPWEFTFKRRLGDV